MHAEYLNGLREKVEKKEKERGRKT